MTSLGDGKRDCFARRKSEARNDQEKRDYFAEETTSLRWQDGESLQAERMSLWDRLEAKIDLAVTPFAGYSELW